MKRKLCIVGAGGHGRVVLDAARSMGCFDDILFVDTAPALHGQSIMDALVVAEPPPAFEVAVHVGLGDNLLRLRILDDLLARGYEAPPIVHERAWVSAYARLKSGCSVMAMAAVNCGAVLDKGVIVNTGAVIEHDCRLAAGVHASPGCRLSGGGHVGRCVHLGTGMSTRQGVTIGEGAIVGAGAVVVADIPSGVTVAGVPAKPLFRERE